jgi:hypothetical protein
VLCSTPVPVCALWCLLHTRLACVPSAPHRQSPLLLPDLITLHCHPCYCSTSREIAGRPLRPRAASAGASGGGGPGDSGDGTPGAPPHKRQRRHSSTAGGAGASEEEDLEGGGHGDSEGGSGWEVRQTPGCGVVPGCRGGAWRGGCGCQGSGEGRGQQPGTGPSPHTLHLVICMSPLHTILRPLRLAPAFPWHTRSTAGPHMPLSCIPHA